MKNPLLPVLVLAALVAATIAGAMIVLFSPAGSERAGVTAAAPGGVGTLAEQVAALQGENRALLERVTALEERPVPAALPPREPVALADEPTREEVGAWMRSFADENGDLPETFVANVGEALDQIRAQESREREERMREEQAQRLEERLETLSVELSLSNYQVDEMRGVLTAQNDRRAQLFVGGWDNVNRETLREDMQSIREETEEALGRILTEEQMDGYRESERRDAGRWFGGGRGPGGGPPGGSGGPGGRGGRGDRGSRGDREGG